MEHSPRDHAAESPFSVSAHAVLASGSVAGSGDFTLRTDSGPARKGLTIIQQAEQLHSAHSLRLSTHGGGEDIDVLQAWKENIKQDATMVKRYDPRLLTRFKLFLNRLCSVPRDPSDASGVDEVQGAAMHPRSSMALLVSLISGVFLIFTVFLVPFELAFFWNVEP